MSITLWTCPNPEPHDWHDWSPGIIHGPKRCPGQRPPEPEPPRIEDVLSEHRDDGIHGDGVMADGEWAWLRCRCGWQKNVSIDDDVTPVFAEWDAHVADELRKRGAV